MSVGLNYQSWLNARPSERKAHAVPLQARATAGGAMRTVALTDAALTVVVVAGLGLSLAHVVDVGGCRGGGRRVGGHGSLPPADHAERGPRGGVDRGVCAGAVPRPGVGQGARCVDSPVDRDRGRRGRQRGLRPVRGLLGDPPHADARLVRRADAVRGSRRRQHQDGGDASRSTPNTVCALSASSTRSTVPVSLSRCSVGWACCAWCCPRRGSTASSSPSV